MVSNDRLTLIILKASIRVPAQRSVVGMRLPTHSEFLALGSGLSVERIGFQVYLYLILGHFLSA